MKELTKAELEIMQVIWVKPHSFLGEIVDSFDEDNRPAYTTISTIVRILEKKGFVAYEKFGKTNRYYPLVSKEEYRGKFLKTMLFDFFDNSPRELLSAFAEEGALNSSQYDELKIFAEKFLKK